MATAVVDRMPTQRQEVRAQRRGGTQGLLRCRLMHADRVLNLTARAGLIVVAETLMALGLEAVVRRELRLRKRQRGLSEFDKLQAIVLLLAAGGDRIEDVRLLREDQALSRLLERAVPSPDALHDFLYAFHDEQELARRPVMGAFIPKPSAALVALSRINRELVQRAVLPQRPTVATLDLDATIIESYKRDTKPHYKGGRGYQPTAVLWAEQDLVVADEYRDGNVPAGMSTRAVAEQAFAALPSSVTQRNFRGDSACYDERLLKWLVRSRIAFTISADMTKELHAECSTPLLKWHLFEDRSDEVVALTEVEFTPGNWPKKAVPLRYVALRFSGKQGRLFSDGKDTKYLAVVSNRHDLAAAELIRWHWQKAGTIEHLHDVTKNELAARLPPSGHFGANAAWYRLNLLTYHVLTTLKRQALPQRLWDAEPKRLRYEVFSLPALVTEHARQLTAKLGAATLSSDELIAARSRLRDLHAQVTDGIAATNHSSA